MTSEDAEWDLKRCLRCAAWIPRPATVCAYCGTSSPDTPIDVRPARNALGLPRSVTATKILIAVNVVYFLWSLYVQFTWTPKENPLRALVTGYGLGDGLRHAGGYMHDRVVTGGEWWRVVTATFLHGGLLHIALNMFALRNLGTVAEEILGSTKYLVVYLVSGICSTLAVSLWFAGILRQEPYFMVGASGAVFGVGGFLAAFLLKRGTEAGRRMGASLARDLGLMLVLGLVLDFVSNTGHVGGLVPGVLFGLTLHDSFSTRVSPQARRNWFLLALLLVVLAIAALVRGVGFSLQHLGAG